MNTKYTRTTITIPEDLLFEIKKKALMERKTVKKIINEIISYHLNYGEKPRLTKKSDNISSLFGKWQKRKTGIAFLEKIRYKDDKKNDKSYLKQLAKVAVGSVSLNNHPEWKTKRKMNNWLRNLREEWQ